MTAGAVGGAAPMAGGARLMDGALLAQKVRAEVAADVAALRSVDSYALTLPAMSHDCERSGLCPD